MKQLPWVLAMLLFLPTVQAGMLFDDFLETGESVSFHSHTFTLQYLPQQRNMLIQSDLRDFFLNYHECRDIAVYTFCFNETRYDPAEGYGGITKDQVAIPAVHLQVRFRKPELDVTRIFTNTHLLVGDYTTITVTLHNPTDQIMEHVRYRDQHPEGVEIFGRTLSGNIFEETVERLLPGETRRFAYAIRFKEPQTYRNQALVQYQSSNVDFRKVTDKVLLMAESPETIPPYNLLLFMDSYSLEVGQTGRLHIVVENYDDEDREIVFAHVFLPEEIRYYGGDFSNKGDKFFADGYVFGKQHREFLLDFIPEREGIFPVTIEVGVRVGTRLIERQASVMLNVYILPLEIKTFKEVNRDQGMLQFWIKARNPNEGIVFQNVHANLDSEFFFFNDAVLNRLEPGEERELYHEKLRLDQVQAHPYFLLKGRYIVDKNAKNILEDLFLQKPTVTIPEQTFGGFTEQTTETVKKTAQTVIVKSTAKVYRQHLREDPKFVYGRNFWKWYTLANKIAMRLYSKLL